MGQDRNISSFVNYNLSYLLIKAELDRANSTNNKVILNDKKSANLFIEVLHHVHHAIYFYVTHYWITHDWNAKIKSVLCSINTSRSTQRVSFLLWNNTSRSTQSLSSLLWENITYVLLPMSDVPHESSLSFTHQVLLYSKSIIYSVHKSIYVLLTI